MTDAQRIEEIRGKNPKRRNCCPLLPDPGPEVVRELCDESDFLLDQLDQAKEQIGHLNRKWQAYEKEIILTCFDWAEEAGVDLRQLVRDNPGKNCVQLLVEALRHQLDQARAENAELRRNYKRILEACEIFKKNSADVTQVWEENRRLREALKPFADKAALYEGRRDDLYIAHGNNKLTVGDCRKAREALQ